MTKSISLKQTAVDIFNTNQYMTLATSDGQGNPWVSPVVYTLDKNFNLYFMSLPDSKHIKNIVKNPVVSVAIFDSHQEFGEGVGLQILGKAEIIKAHQAVSVFRLYFGRKWSYGKLENVKNFERFFRVYKYRFYKVSPTDIWMNDPRCEYDKRVRINI